MKKIVLIAFCLGLSGLSGFPVRAAAVSSSDSVTSVKTEHKVKRKTGKKQKADTKVWLASALENRCFGIEIDKMFGPAGVVTLPRTGLFFVKDGRVKTALPYVGRYSAPNLAVRSPRLVELDDMAVDYRVDTLRRGYRVKFNVYRTGERIEVELRVDRNGYTTLYLYSSLRSDIRYAGRMKLLPDIGIGKGL